ncbi:MAG: hypothetical protein JWN37_737 [Candidatus Nomurabacteria bacterium]|nr:hypothetical protein [Candidatus Nomurabacteria bacterium]
MKMLQGFIEKRSQKYCRKVFALIKRLFANELAEEKKVHDQQMKRDMLLKYGAEVVQKRTFVVMTTEELIVRLHIDEIALSRNPARTVVFRRRDLWWLRDMVEAIHPGMAAFHFDKAYKRLEEMGLVKIGVVDDGQAPYTTSEIITSVKTPIDLTALLKKIRGRELPDLMGLLSS